MEAQTIRNLSEPYMRKGCLCGVSVVAAPKPTSTSGSCIPRPKTRGIPETMVYRILTFIYAMVKAPYLEPDSRFYEDPT